MVVYLESCLKINTSGMRLFLIISLCVSVFTTKAQDNIEKSGNIAKYVGKYEANGTVVQVALINRLLVLIVPGAPIQELISVGADKFKTDAFSNEIFLFVKKNGKIETMISQRPGKSFELRFVGARLSECDKIYSLQR